MSGAETSHHAEFNGIEMVSQEFGPDGVRVVLREGIIMGSTQIPYELHKQIGKMLGKTETGESA